MRFLDGVPPENFIRRENHRVFAFHPLAYLLRFSWSHMIAGPAQRGLSRLPVMTSHLRNRTNSSGMAPACCPLAVHSVGSGLVAGIWEMSVKFIREVR